MSDLLTRYRKMPYSDLATLQEAHTSPLVNAYIEHFNGDTLVAQVAMIEDIFRLANPGGIPPVGVVLAVKAMAG